MTNKTNKKTSLIDEQGRVLKKNTVLIAVANLGSKLVNFILAPLYARYLSPVDYGTTDLIMTTLSLLLPFVCLNIYEATFRFGSNDKKRNQVNLSTSIILCIVPTLLIGSIAVISSISKRHTDIMFPLICLGLVFSIYSTVLSYYMRGIGKIAPYAFNGLFNAIVNLIVSIVFIVRLHMGLVGWVWALVISNFASVVVLALYADARHTFNINSFDFSHLKKCLKYCIPLMPGAILWWVMNASDRYIIALFISSSANGIYAISNKFPGLFSTIESIFYQAWTSSAVALEKLDDKNRFYSDILEKYVIIIFVTICGLLFVTQPANCILFGKKYESAWMFSFPLIFAVAVHALNSFLGSFYIVEKKTKGAFYSTLIGALINTSLNFIFIPKFGIMAAAFTTLIGYVCTLVYRIFDTRKLGYKMNISIKLTNIAFVCISGCLYYVDAMWSFVIRIGVLIAIVIFNRELLFSLIKKN